MILSAKKPIKLHIPDYYDEELWIQNRLQLTKTKSLLKEDVNRTKYIASIEAIEGYQCNIPEIGRDKNSITTRVFHKDREEGWTLRSRVSGCEVATHSWSSGDIHFHFCWIMISEQYMLQLVGIFEPRHSGFYRAHFITSSLDAEIDLTFNYSEEKESIAIFECVLRKTSPEDLLSLIDSERVEIEKANFLEENLKVSNPHFFFILENELKECEEVVIDSFMCQDWNAYYELYNPENFSNPDSKIEWESNAGVFEYYEHPNTNSSKVIVACNEENFCLDSLKVLYQRKDSVEQDILSLFERYTFGGNGAYASAIHYKYAKIEIERLHSTALTNQEFLKRNLYLNDIVILSKHDELKLHFKCGWDTEHGVEVVINKDMECRIEG